MGRRIENGFLKNVFFYFYSIQNNYFSFNLLLQVDVVMEYMILKKI